MQREIDSVPRQQSQIGHRTELRNDKLPQPSFHDLHGADVLVGTVLSSGRYFILLAILGSFITSCAVLLYALFAGVLDAFGDAIQHEFGADGAKHVSVEVIILVDLFPLGTVLYVVAVGLYQLFINPNLRTPSWLKITHLDDLKERLCTAGRFIEGNSIAGLIRTSWPYPRLLCSMDCRARAAY